MRHSDATTLDSCMPINTQSLDDECLFVNRELSWIAFNRRVLHEAQRVAKPLLERVKFLSILSSNIDEFYMKRLGGLKHKITAGDSQRSIDGLTPVEQLSLCRLALEHLQIEKELAYRDIYEEMKRNDIEILEYRSLDVLDKSRMNAYYRDNIESRITALPIDPAEPFPFLLNLSLYLLVSTQCTCGGGVSLALIQIPSGPQLPRFVQIDNHHRYILLEDLIAANVIKPLSDAEIVTTNKFRITRSAVSYRDYAELDDQREMIEEVLHDRQHASVIRLQVCPLMTQSIRHSLARSLNLDATQDVIESIELLRMSDLRELATLDISRLREAPHRQHMTLGLTSDGSILNAVRERSNIILQHPYESFTQSVERFVHEASQDSDVIAINMTLYRTSVDTRIVDYLIAAAESGKQVSVVVELKARFDEASNLRWARRLEQAGVRVYHGIAELKTHCKFILVLKRDQEKLRRYAHIGTGNYHAGTAQLYTDIGLLTCDDVLTADIDELFTHLTRSNRSTCSFKHILATPHVIKRGLLERIENVIGMHSTASPGYICMKTNALEDPDITLALYQASQAGVKVNLIVRDICRVRPGINGMSDNISVISIVGRFLEHSRLYLFGNGGNDDIYIGSADLMTRNLEKRVELLIPITDQDSKRRLRGILSQHLRDNCNAWILLANGTYRKKIPYSEDKLVNSQHPVSQSTSIPADIFLSNEEIDASLAYIRVSNADSNRTSCITDL